MVMVPDMAAFAPHIHAVFARFQAQSPVTASRHLPYAVADTATHLEPTVQALQTLLQLPQLRLSLGEWLGLFQVEMVRNRYDLQAQDVQDLHKLLSDAGVRWGLDGQHRQHWGVQANIDHHAHNTWVFGLQRLLLGYALGVTDNAHATWQDTFAQTGVDGLDAPVVSALLRCLQLPKCLANVVSPSRGTSISQIQSTTCRAGFATTADSIGCLLLFLNPSPGLLISA
jgi:exodeoxyribonuclease V gamma subunit